MPRSKKQSGFRRTSHKKVTKEGNKNQNLPTNLENSVPSNVEVKRPSLSQSVKSGFGFGLGSAVAHTAVSGIASKVLDSSNDNQRVNQGENQKIEECANLFKKYVNCLQLHHYNDLQHECVEMKKVIDTMKCNDYVK